MIEPKFTIHREVIYPHHRNGWPFVVSAMSELIRDDGEGILLDCSVERSFARDLEKARAEGWLPFRRPWVGFVHCPPEIPEWSEAHKSIRKVRILDEWNESFKECKGLVTFSRWMAERLREEFPLPVLPLRHPVPKPPKYFQWEAFEGSAARGVVQVGSWLRRFSSIHFLPIDPSRKRLLIPVDAAQAPRYWKTLEAERRVSGAPPFGEWNCTVLDRLPNDAYDDLLASHVVFLDLAGAVANNAVLECIARHTPLLVSRLPSVMEYLGPEYPLYFDSLEEAAAKAENLALLEAGHRYLEALPKEPLSPARFLQDFAGSAFYQGL
ncbi:MAG: hypothetical protein IT170_07325 [Bryobacterales bacterium]|nr:hypothetical protein [Bryobacterales bacterium]